MIRLILLFLVSLIWNISHAQLNYGLQVATGFSYRKSLPVGDTQIEELLQIDQFERGKMGYTVGARVEFGSASKVGFQTGLNYQRAGYRTQREEFLISVEGTEEVGEREQQFAFQNVEIPLILNFYQDMTATGRVYFKLGGSILYHLKKEATTRTFIGGALSNESQVALNRGVNVNMGIVAGVGYQQQLSNNLTLFVEPIFNYYLRASHEDDDFARQPYFLGLNIGLKI